MPGTRQLLVIGWDAADWKIASRLVDVGLMPHLQGMIERGAMANLATLTPILSPMLWTSIATGKRPFKHGILGFAEPTPDGASVQPVTNLSRRTKALWNILNQNGLRCHVVGWWPSHPAEPIDGVMVSNHYQRAPGPGAPQWPVAPGTIHPAERTAELAGLRVHPTELTSQHLAPFIPHGADVDQTRDARMASCAKILADCTTIHACATHLLEEDPWDAAFVYYDAIDHWGHGFMRYHPPQQEQVSDEDFRLYGNVVSAGYVYHDMLLGRLLELAGDETTVILLSDHGFHPDHLRPRAIPSEPAGPAAEHREFGILVMQGPGIRRDEILHGATLLDITPTALAALGLAVGEDMDGHVLNDAFQTPPAVSTIASWDDVPGPSGQHPPDRHLDPHEAAEALRQLVDLGYIDEPPQDKAQAVADTRRELDYNLAQAYMDAGLHADAAQLLGRLYAASPLEFRFGVKLARCLQGLGRIDEMDAIVSDLDRRWRKAAGAARDRLRELAEIGRQRRADLGVGEPRDDEAEAEADDLDVFDPGEKRVIGKLRAIARGNPHAIDYLAGAVAAARGDHEAALERLAAAQASSSSVPGFHLATGNALLALGRRDEAEQSFRRLLELDPDNAYGHVALAQLLLGLGRDAEALAMARQAVGLRHHMPAAHHYLGVALARAGDTERAADALHRAIAQNPNFSEAHAELVRIHEGRGEPELAARHHEQVAAIEAAREQQRATRDLPELPGSDEIDFEAELPRLPAPAITETRRAWLGLPPADEERPTGEAAAPRPFVTIVSGLPRSGASMMMQMLAAGGLAPLVDNPRPADDASGPGGDVELARLASLRERNDWLDEARGRALKVVAPLIPDLPQGCDYRAIVMERDLGEVLASQRRQLERLGGTAAPLDDARLERLLARQLRLAGARLEAHGVPVLRVAYAEALDQPDAVAGRVAGFLGLELDCEAMAAAVDPGRRREGQPDPASA